MRLAFVLATIVGFALACSSSDVPEAGAAPAAVGSAPATQARPATHRLLGILDPDRQNMVAFALKVPVGWETSQSFTRAWDGAVATPQITLRLKAPDGSAAIEYLPVVQHIWSEGPMTQQLRAQKQSFGMDTRMAENELQPMPASAYCRQAIVPSLAKQGLSIQNVHGAKDAAEERPSPQQVARRGSVDGTLADGTKVRVECRMRIDTQQSNGETYMAWRVVPSVTRARGDLEAAHAQTRIAQDSIVPNPAWQKLEQEAADKGARANSDASRSQHEATMGQIQQNTDAMTAAHNQRMADIQAAGAASTAAHNQRMNDMDASMQAQQAQGASNDRQHEYTIDGINEVSKYADPATGEKVKVEDGYDNVYRANDGLDMRNTTILATDAPIDPQQVDWQQLQKLTQQEY